MNPTIAQEARRKIAKALGVEAQSVSLSASDTSVSIDLDVRGPKVDSDKLKFALQSETGFGVTVTTTNERVERVMLQGNEAASLIDSLAKINPDRVKKEGGVELARNR